MTSFIHLEQLRVGKVFTFFLLCMSQVGVGQVVCLIFAWYLSQVGVGQVRFFFLPGILDQIRGVPADGEKRVPPTA